jgi:hypothetical protein
MIWNYDELWQKAKLYIERALSQDREGPWFPFYAILGLEFLGRTSLARIHPVLLADPRGDDILYAFGFGTTRNPKSITAKTVFSRCGVIMPAFGKEEFDIAMGLIERRNQELHSGDPSFQDFPTRLWLAKYFYICSLLLEFQSKQLADLFGPKEADAASKMIVALREEVLTEVRKAIAQHRKAFEDLSEAQRINDKTIGEAKAMKAGQRGKIVSCPACNNASLIAGEAVSVKDPEVTDDGVAQDTVFLPTHFQCFVCGLDLAGHARLHAADLGGQFSLSENFDPVEYYNIDVDEYVDIDQILRNLNDDYGND